MCAAMPQVEERKRQKARSNAANTAKPLWEEDGKKRSLLDKCVQAAGYLGAAGLPHPTMHAYRKSRRSKALCRQTSLVEVDPWGN